MLHNTVLLPVLQAPLTSLQACLLPGVVYLYWTYHIVCVGQSAGARVLPIPYDLDDGELKEM